MEKRGWNASRKDLAGQRSLNCLNDQSLDSDAARGESDRWQVVKLREQSQTFDWESQEIKSHTPPRLKRKRRLHFNKDFYFIGGI